MAAAMRAEAEARAATLEALAAALEAANDDLPALVDARTCGRWSVGAGEFRAAVESGELAARKLGRRYVVAREDLEAWLATRPRAETKADRAAKEVDDMLRGLGVTPGASGRSA